MINQSQSSKSQFFFFFKFLAYIEMVLGNGLAKLSVHSSNSVFTQPTLCAKPEVVGIELCPLYWQVFVGKRRKKDGVADCASSS